MRKPLLTLWLAAAALCWAWGGAIARAGEVGPAGSDSPATMDQAIAMIERARERFKGVSDYECLVVKRERLGGVLQPEAMLEMKVRTKPLAIYLKGLSPRSEKGMEISFVEGRNNGMMRLHLNGFIGLFGFFSIAPDDPRVLQRTRHSIRNADLGGLLEETARHFSRERDPAKTQVHITEEQVGGRTAYLVETVHPEANPGLYYGYRCQIWLDKETMMPAGAATYDWPKRNGEPGGDLLESYRFHALKLNPGITDRVFFK